MCVWVANLVNFSGNKLIKIYLITSYVFNLENRKMC